MDGIVFDAMLKTALEEALRRDVEEAPEPPAPSRRQRKRMRALLAEPRRFATGAPETEAGKRRRMPARWLAVAILAALLTATAAAGLVQGSGEWFQQWFQGRDAAARYGSAADTDQLLDMGSAINTPVVEGDGFRFEIQDVVCDGQRALIAVRVTVLEQALLERMREDEALPDIEVEPPKDTARRREGSYGCAVRDDPEEGQYLLEFSITDTALDSGEPYSIRLIAPLFVPEGGWTLTVTPQFVEPLTLEPKQVCQVNGVDWMLDSVTLTPLTLRFSFHCMITKRQEYWDPWKTVEFHMKDGEVINHQGCSGGTSGGGHQISTEMNLPMPLDLEQVDFLRIYGIDVYLEE